MFRLLRLGDTQTSVFKGDETLKKDRTDKRWKDHIIILTTPYFIPFPRSNDLSPKDISYLDSGVTAEIKVEFCGMGDAHVDRRPGRNVPTLANLLTLVRTKQSRVMAFLSWRNKKRRLVYALL